MYCSVSIYCMARAASSNQRGCSVYNNCFLHFAGFLWWSVFDALLPMLWFFPLCALEVSGYEPIIILWFSPLLALWSPIRRALATPSALLVLRLLTLVGVASYQTPTSISRLVVLAVGNMFTVLAFVSMWWDRSKLDR